MSEAPTPNRTRLAAAAGLLGASAVTALLLGVGLAPSALQLAGASRDDTPGDIRGNCDEAEHANDPECAGTPTTDHNTSTTVDDSTSTTADDGNGSAADEIRTLDAAGAGTVIYAVEGGNLRLVSATPASGWAVEVEQGTGREIELDFRSGGHRVQVNVEIEDGQARERVRVRDDDGTDIRTEDGVVQDDNSNSGPGSGSEVGDDNSNSGPGSDDSADDHSGSGHDDDDSSDDSSGSGRDHPEDD